MQTLLITVTYKYDTTIFENPTTSSINIFHEKFTENVIFKRMQLNVILRFKTNETFNVQNNIICEKTITLHQKKHYMMFVLTYIIHTNI